MKIVLFITIASVMLMSTIALSAQVWKDKEGNVVNVNGGVVSDNIHKNESRATPLSGTRWFYRANKYTCAIFEFENDIVTFYHSTCSGNYSSLGSNPYKINRANNGMYNVKILNDDMTINSSYFVGFTNDNSQLLKCPADNWESCKYGEEWHKK